MSYCLGAHGAIISWDITDRKSFTNMRSWMKLWRNYAIPKYEQNVVMIGNKCDDEEHREVTFAEGEALAAEYGCAFFETSAKENINVEEVFMYISTLMVTGNAPSEDILLK